MMVWENSDQSSFSCSSGSKALFSGFADISPEEQRFEYYSTKSYLDGISWLLIQWGDRMNQSTRAALIAELRYPAPRTSSSGFGSAPAGCGNKGFEAEPPAQATNISLASPASGLGSPVAPTSPPGFSGAIPAVTQPPSGSDATPSTSSDDPPGSPSPARLAKNLRLHLRGQVPPPQPRPTKRWRSPAHLQEICQDRCVRWKPQAVFTHLRAS
ncbi:nucleoporin NUP42-like [Nerophis ophidion]|uniref:nucleoporin NUP42-like n=1 Tax=Nerophis ophidion TaxID=159077 RepID=UPI002ADF3C71|nr:nucleoporin NUP42-like [Nerophis ophidion]XP_061738027.1 nucleoporin NUP42-like [Nerophis ophidion]XP_061738028.1 nucleoporin NUP42-like [Nerophis ophidion]XP_061738029.1 nucleoporin NUP42-like [Nerophis ophidion]